MSGIMTVHMLRAVALFVCVALGYSVIYMMYTLMLGDDFKLRRGNKHMVTYQNAMLLSVCTTVGGRCDSSFSAHSDLGRMTVMTHSIVVLGVHLYVSLALAKHMATSFVSSE